MNVQQTKIIVILLCGACTVLVSRLLLLLFAARPDNPSVELILMLSEPLAWPLSWIDASQPVYGARFERGTLLTIGGCLTGLWLVTRRHT